MRDYKGETMTRYCKGESIMRYRAIVKSAKELTGIDCDALRVNVNDRNYYYTSRMNSKAGKWKIFESFDVVGTVVYFDGEDEYLKGWLKDIKPTPLFGNGVIQDKQKNICKNNL